MSDNTFKTTLLNQKLHNVILKSEEFNDQAKNPQKLQVVSELDAYCGHAHKALCF